MGCCSKNRVKYQCDVETASDCVSYNTQLPEWSSLSTCVSADEALNEIYSNISGILSDIDISDINDCSDYSSDEKTIPTVLANLATEVCNLKEQLSQSSEAFDITRLNLGCLEEECEAKITTFPELIQTIVDKLCPGWEDVFLFKISNSEAQINWSIGMIGGTVTYPVSSLRNSDTHPWLVQSKIINPSHPEWVTVNKTQSAITLSVGEYNTLASYIFTIDNSSEGISLYKSRAAVTSTHTILSTMDGNLKDWNILGLADNPLHPSWVTVTKTQSSISLNIAAY